MPRIEQTIMIDALPEDVWRVAGDPARIGEWLPALSGASLDGAERTCTTADGGIIRERIIEHSDAQRHYTYEIVEASLSVSSYRSTLAVDGHGEHSHVTWTAEFEPADPAIEEEVAAALDELYRDGLESLQAQIESGS